MCKYRTSLLATLRGLARQMIFLTSRISLRFSSFFCNLYDLLIRFCSVAISIVNYRLRLDDANANTSVINQMVVTRPLRYKAI